jgi:monomeric sarcosine oxidase
LGEHKYDYLVVGAGVFGAWTACFLARRGKSVLLVDARGPGNALSSSGGETRIIRMGYGFSELYTRFARRSLTLWREFEQACGETVFKRTGVLWLARPEETLLAETRRVLTRQGIAFETMGAKELRSRYPQIRVESDVEALLEPEAGALFAGQAVAAVTRAAQAAGADYASDTVLPGMARRELPEVRTRSGAILRARTFVFACGAWLPSLFPAELKGIITPTRQNVFHFRPPERGSSFAAAALPIWIDSTQPRSPYGFPNLADLGFKLAFHQRGEPIDPESADRTVPAREVETARSYLASRFPALAEAPLLSARACVYENTASGDFLIGRHPDLANVWWVGGGSGHGFKHGPAVGEYVVQQLEEGGPADPAFSLPSGQDTRRPVF